MVNFFILTHVSLFVFSIVSFFLIENKNKLQLLKKKKRKEKHLTIYIHTMKKMGESLSGVHPIF